MTICQPRQVLRQTLYGTLLINARPLSRLSGFGSTTSSDPAAKNSTKFFQKQLASRRLIYSCNEMERTFNKEVAGSCSGIATTFDEYDPVMVHKINRQLSIRTDFSALQMTVLKHGIEIDWRDCSGLSLTSYNRLFRSLVILHTQGRTEVGNG
jgi:hypothetical protein